MADPSISPSPAEQERAKWVLVQAQIDQVRKQARWETPRAIAMLALALAALLAATRLSDFWFPVKPQSIAVHFDQPIVVKLGR